MSNPTNDIDALLRYLDGGASPWWADSVRALVADRDALKRERQMYWESCDALEKQTIDLKARVAELEKSAFYIPPKHPPADRDRELRERLVESALRGLNVSGLHRSEAELIGKLSVWIVNGALAAMRKGESDGK